MPIIHLVKNNTTTDSEDTASVVSTFETFVFLQNVLWPMVSPVYAVILWCLQRNGEENA
jgi:hypothetical protein